MTHQLMRENSAKIRSAINDVVRTSTESICSEISSWKNDPIHAQEALIAFINNNNGFSLLRQAQRSHLIEASEQLLSQNGPWLASGKKQNTDGVEPTPVTNDIGDYNHRRPSSENLTLLLQMQGELRDLAHQVALLSNSPSITRDRLFPKAPHEVRQASKLILYLVRGIRQLLAHFWYVCHYQ